MSRPFRTEYAAAWYQAMNQPKILVDPVGLTGARISGTLLTTLTYYHFERHIFCHACERRDAGKKVRNFVFSPNAWCAGIHLTPLPDSI